MGKLAEQLGSRIRKARENKDLTQKDLSDLLSVTHQTVGKYERGETALSLDEIETIAKKLEIPIEQLFPAFNSISSMAALDALNIIRNALVASELSPLERDFIDLLRTLDKGEALKLLARLRLEFSVDVKSSADAQDKVK